MMYTNVLHLDLVTKHMLLRNIYIRIINHVIFYVYSKADMSCNRNIVHYVVILFRSYAHTCTHTTRYYISTFSAIPSLKTNHYWLHCELFLRFNYRKSLRRFSYEIHMYVAYALCLFGTRERESERLSCFPTSCVYTPPSYIRARSTNVLQRRSVAKNKRKRERERESTVKIQYNYNGEKIK